MAWDPLRRFVDWLSLRPISPPPSVRIVSPNPPNRPLPPAISPTPDPWALDVPEIGRTIQCGECIFVTGGAGSGKSTILRSLQERLGFQAVTIAPTGVAALNASGMTIHKTLSLPPRLLDPDRDVPPSDSRKWSALRVVLVDEISMVRADLMDCIHRYATAHGPDPSSPWGGMAVIVFGDLGQLPPVVETKLLPVFTTPHELTRYQSPWFFAAPALHSGIVTHRLKGSYRHRDDTVFLEILNAIRMGEPTREQLAQLNTRVLPPHPESLWLSFKRDAAAAINNRELNRLPVPQFSSDCAIVGAESREPPEFNPKDYPAPAHLSLRVGARVMLLKNGPGYVNGSMGSVTGIDQHLRAVSVLLDDPRIEINLNRATWPIYGLEKDRSTKRLRQVQIGNFEQYPLDLGWARTVWKAQGLTIPKVHLLLDGPAFAHGLVYVGLSRVRRLSDLTLGRPITLADCQVDPRVVDGL
jgi:ATP-dependent DNA helicase PIF1